MIPPRRSRLPIRLGVNDEDQQLAEQIVERARTEGLDLVGPDGVLTGLTKKVLEAGLEAELTEHLGYDKHAVEGRTGGNSRNGTRAKTVITEVGPVPLDVPRDRDGTFQPQLVRKRQRRLHGVDEMVISLTAQGLTTGEVSAHLAEWLNRPLEQVYAPVFIDAIVVKIRDGQVANRLPTAPSGSPWTAPATFWGSGSAPAGRARSSGCRCSPRSRTAAPTTCASSCDGLKGLSEAIEATWPLAVIHTCVLHLIRNTFRLASRRDWDKMAKDLRPVYTAATEQAAKERLGEFQDIWGERYPAIIRLRENAWAEFLPS